MRAPQLTIDIGMCPVSYDTGVLPTRLGKITVGRCVKCDMKGALMNARQRFASCTNGVLYTLRHMEKRTHENGTYDAEGRAASTDIDVLDKT